jgi:uncharacterized protein
MIKINILKLTFDGKCFEGVEDSNLLDIENTEYVECPNGIKYSLFAALVNNGVLVRGVAETDIICKCGLCLSNYTFKVKNDTICHFYEEENKNEIDLTDDIREDILIRFPVNLKCSENCKGLCTECGQNLNEDECSCSENSEDENLWNELDKLKF